jgi:hypothetical protein
VPAPGNPPPRKQIKKLKWVRGVVRITQTQTLTVVACVILLYCSAAYLVFMSAIVGSDKSCDRAVLLVDS